MDRDQRNFTQADRAENCALVVRHVVPLLAIAWMASCQKAGSDTSGSPAQDQAKSLWSTDQILEGKSNCLEETDNAFGEQKAAVWCACIVEKSSKRWTYDDFLSNTVTYAKAMRDDGTAQECNDLAGLGRWSPADILTVRGACVETYVAAKPSVTTGAATVVCGCLVEDASRRWTTGDYQANEVTHAKEQADDGTMKKCIELAGLTSAGTKAADFASITPKFSLVTAYTPDLFTATFEKPEVSATKVEMSADPAFLDSIIVDYADSVSFTPKQHCSTLQNVYVRFLSADGIVSQSVAKQVAPVSCLKRLSIDPRVTPRSSPGVAWADGQMYLYRGSDVNFSEVMDSWIFDPLNGTWTGWNMNGSPDDGLAFWSRKLVSVGSHLVVWNEDDLFGMDPLDPASGTGLYDAKAGTWGALSNANFPDGSGYIVPMDDYAIVWGGKAGPWLNYTTFNTGHLFHPSTNIWTNMSAVGAPSLRNNEAVVWSGKDLVVWGGIYSGTTLGTGSVYSPATNSWFPVSMTNAPTARSSPHSASVGSNVVIWGGSDNGFVSLNDGGIFDATTNSWKSIAATVSPKSKGDGGAFLATNDEIFYLSGWNGGGVSCATDSKGYFFNPSTNSWREANIPQDLARCYAGVVWTGKYIMVTHGSMDPGADALTTDGYILYP